jgi:hypothetical protein
MIGMRCDWLMGNRKSLLLTVLYSYSIPGYPVFIFGLDGVCQHAYFLVSNRLITIPYTTYVEELAYFRTDRHKSKSLTWLIQSRK